MRDAVSVSFSYKAGMTLRFPRLEKIRSDKEWFECLDLNEVGELFKKAQGKLSYRRTTASDEPEPKKRKRTVTRVERPLTVAKHFETADASAVQEVCGMNDWQRIRQDHIPFVLISFFFIKKSEIFDGKEFYIVNGPPECGKVQLERKVLEV